MSPVLTLAFAGACAGPPEPLPLPPAPRTEVATVYRLTQAPAPAATCIAAHAAHAAEGAVARIQPLYGMERLAVIVLDRPAGDALAVAYVDPATTGSQMRLTVTLRFTGDREALARRLAAGC